MILPRYKIDERILREERMRGARVLVHIRWAFVLLITILLLFQYLSGYQQESRIPFLVVAGYFLVNLVLSITIRRGYDPRYLRFLSATIDLLFIVSHLFIMTVSFDPTAATAASTIFLIPFFFLLYILRLDRGLLFYMIVLAIAGFNFNYFYSYFADPSPYQHNLSLTPLAHIFKSVYIAFTGLLVIYLQSSFYRLLQKQVTVAAEKARLNVELQMGREQSQKVQEMARQERMLNIELEDEIRKRDQYASELKETQQLVNTLISNLLGAVSRCKWDEHFTTIFYSDKILDITGYSSEELIDNRVMSFAELILPEDVDMVRHQIEAAVAAKRSYSLEFRIRHRDGTIVWINETGQPLFDENGEIAYLDGITTDITDRKQAEQSYRELTELLPQTVYELDSEGYLLFSNRAAADFFGEGVPDESGRIHVSQFFSTEQVGRAVGSKGDEPELYHGKRQVTESVARRADGTECPVLIYSSAIVHDGVYQGQRGIIADISDIKRTEEQLKRAKDELERLNAELEKTVAERTAELTEANTQLLRLQKENLQSQFEVLKQQVNPHFLFNSLNVLTSLITVDPGLAELFTERLSKVYRYVLENKEKDLVALSTEMEFLRAYIFLLDIRFAKKVFTDIEFDEKDVDALVVPLALQLLIENAIKHNTFSKKSPLHIRLFIDDENYLNIVNNIQVRETEMKSTGIGLINIKKRYELLSEREPLFEIGDNMFIARIPLIKEGG